MKIITSSFFASVDPIYHKFIPGLPLCHPLSHNQFAPSTMAQGLSKQQVCLATNLWLASFGRISAKRKKSAQIKLKSMQWNPNISKHISQERQRVETCVAKFIDHCRNKASWYKITHFFFNNSYLLNDNFRLYYWVKIN